jgi:branched-chain amino acid aminotransferase
MSTGDGKGIEARRIWVDGTLVPWREATIHVLSQSAARGSLVFDVMPCYAWPDGPAIFGMREHTERFIRSAGLSGMTLRLGLEDLLAAIGETVRANPGTQIVKINAYHPGVSLDVLPVDTEASVAIAAFALADLIPGLEKVGDMPPARLQVTDVRKMPTWVISPQAKLAAGYLYTAVAKQIARKEGFDDVLLLDERGDVAESSTQSFFLVEGGTLYTASVDTVLGGITRRAVLELAQDEGIPAVEGHVAAARLDSADEAFMAGTTTNIWPVSQISSRELPAPVPGAITDTLRNRINRVIAGEDARFSPRWMQKV